MKRVTSNSSTDRVADPPLERTERVEADPKTGKQIPVTVLRRGVLATKTHHYELDDLAARQPVNARQALENHCDYIRDYLTSKGLPSDRQPHWMLIDGEWRAVENPAAIRELNPKIAWSHWSKRLETMTEPLTFERKSGELLDAITRLLRRNGIDEHLWHIGQVMNIYSEYRIAGSINRLAHQAIKAKTIRLQGPQAVKLRALAVRSVICEQARKYWATCASARDASSTAAAIAADVNRELKAKGLLQRGKHAYSAKTIGDHIRQGIRGKEFATG